MSLRGPLAVLALGAVPIAAPVFIAQGTSDTVVSPAVTARHVGRLCGQGIAVRYLVMPDEKHFLAALHSAREAVAWIGDRLAGKPAPDDCAGGGKQGTAPPRAPAGVAHGRQD
jgi:alpha-beta hydrolase superfamily lysophospholipase